MTQAEAGQALGVHEFTISRWETGARTPGSRNYNRAIAFYEARSGDTKPSGVPRGTSEYPAVSDRWQDLLSRFGRIAIRRGATDLEVDFLQAALALPEAEALGREGLPDGASDVAVFDHAQEVFAGLLRWIGERVDQRRHGSIVDAPAIPVGAREEDEPQEPPARRKA